jgi:translation initiation factor IF-3
MAEESGYDLVNISPKADPPVCRIIDYGKYKFEQGKKQKEARKNQKVTEVKEMRLSPTIDVNDLQFKAKNVSKFLENGDKVKVSVRFRGRQLSHTAIGKEVMDSFVSMVGNCVVEKEARMDGRNMVMILAPKN